MLFFGLGAISGITGLVIFATSGWEITGPDGLLFGFSGFFSLCGILWSIGHRAEKRMPRYSVQAKVFAKTTNTSGGGTSYAGNGQFSSDSATTKHFVAFEFDGRRENFAVIASVYNTVNENDMGVLEYRDRHGTLEFINFTLRT